jgi:tetratricopeptide (TPR) repeat protein
MRDLFAASRFREAVEHYRRELQAEQGRRPELVLLAAIAATRIESLELAEELAALALGRFTRIGDSDGRMRALNLLGAVNFKHGRLGEAEQSFSRALRFAFQLDDTLFVARTSNNLATIADLRGDPATALALYRSALLSYQRLGDRRGTAETYHNLSLTYRQMERWDEAERVSTEALRHADVLHEHALLALAVCGRAELHLEHGEVDVAARSLDRAACIAEDADNAVSLGDVQRVRALVALRRQDYTTARDCAEHARTVAVQYGNALLLADANAASALALRALGDTALAEERRKLAADGYAALGATHFATCFERQWSGRAESRRRTLTNRGGHDRRRKSPTESELIPEDTL